MIQEILFAMIAALTVMYVIWIVTIMLPRKAYRAYAPPVSIIIPAHNEQEHIAMALESMLSQNYPRKEIIVVDDGSTDKTAEIAKSYGVKVLSTKHIGKAAAMNAALGRAKHGVIVTMDADSVLAKGSLRNLVKPLADPRVGASTGIIRAKATLNPLTWFQDYEYIMSSGWRYACSNVNGNSIVPGFAAFRRDALRAVKGFGSDTLTEDFDVVISLSNAGYRTVTVRNASIITSVPQTIDSLIRQRLRWGSGTLQVIGKHSRFIASRKSGTLGWLTIPTQFYWYIHALMYLPITLYMIFLVWPSPGMNALEFARYLLTMFSVYGIIDLVMKVATRQYELSAMIAISLVSFFLSLAYTVIVFAKITRPSLRVLACYIFFFPYSLFNLIILGISAGKALVRPKAINRWTG